MYAMGAALVAGSFSDDSRQATVQLVSFTPVRNALHMGGHEFKDLANGVAWQPLQSLGEPQPQPLVCFAAVLVNVGPHAHVASHGTLSVYARAVT